MFKTILTAAAVATVGLTAVDAGLAAPAEARGRCIPVYGVRVMNDAIAGGASVATAWQWAIEDGYAVDTGRCWTMTKGYGRGLNFTFPYFYRAVWGR